nr:hypothetical protein [uncultured Campylobacter sp.]
MQPKLVRVVWTQGQLFTAARAHSFGRRSLITLAQSGVEGDSYSPWLVHNSDAGAQSLVLQLKRSDPTLALRLATRSSTGEDNCSAYIRLIQAKKSNRAYEISVPTKAMLGAFLAERSNRLKF